LILAVDVDYDNNHGFAAGVGFENWTDEFITSSFTSYIEQVSDYIPGQFYKRELPCILKLLTEHNLAPATIVIDGYVYLDGSSSPGLGKYLYDALQYRVKIIGVAKKPFLGVTAEHEIVRGASKRPLYVTCAGEPLNIAKQRVVSMHGVHRIPTVLKKVDQLCRNNHRGK